MRLTAYSRPWQSMNPLSEWLTSRSEGARLCRHLWIGSTGLPLARPAVHTTDP